MDGKKDGVQKYRVRINYTDHEGKSRQLDRVAYGKEEAKELERRLYRDLSDETTKKITVQELYDEYISVKKNEIRESSLDRSVKILSTYITPYFKDIKIDKLNISSLQKWKTYIDECKTSANENFSIGYKQKIFAVFRALLNYAVKMEYINSNLLSKLGNFKDVNMIKQDMDFYTSDEFLQFIKAAHSFAISSKKASNNINEWNYYIFFNIAFYTGMRKGEINALKWSDIDGETIHITRSIAQKLKGGDRETPPKNKSSIRTIQIPTPLKKVLNEHYSRYKQVSGFSDNWRICGGKTCIRDSTIGKRNKLYAEAAGLKKIRIHDFRHSHASLLANNGINIQEIARRLGHSNIEETWNTYSHLYPHEEEKAVEILNKII